MSQTQIVKVCECGNRLKSIGFPDEILYCAKCKRAVALIDEVSFSRVYREEERELKPKTIKNYLQKYTEPLIYSNGFN